MDWCFPEHSRREKARIRKTKEKVRREESVWKKVKQEQKNLAITRDLGSESPDRGCRSTIHVRMG